MSDPSPSNLLPPLYEKHSDIATRSEPVDGVVAVRGATKVHLLFRGADAPYFGRGAARLIKLEAPSDFQGEFQLVATAASAAAFAPDAATRPEVVLGTSKNRELIPERDFSAEFTKESFSSTKLPYGAFNVSSESGYVNLCYFQRLLVRLVGADGAPLEEPLRF